MFKRSTWQACVKWGKLKRALDDRGLDPKAGGLNRVYIVDEKEQLIHCDSTEIRYAFLAVARRGDDLVWTIEVVRCLPGASGLRLSNGNDQSPWLRWR
jgi:hypothetical protein